ncbi:1-acyl-sn-glycerol-3-phosphate acyltransferase, partial [Verminephrobacter sp. Larva24]
MAAIRSVIHLLWMGLTVVPYALAILLGALLGL